MTRLDNGKSKKPISIYRQEYRKFRKFLKDNREKRGLSQAELGMLIGQDQTFVSKYETGIRRLDIIETWDICQALEINIHDLLRELGVKDE